MLCAPFRIAALTGGSAAIKPARLRTHLVAALPEMDREADRLLVFIDAGSLTSTFQKGLSFE